MMLPIDLNLLNHTPAKYTPTEGEPVKDTKALVQNLKAILARFKSTTTIKIESQTKTI